MKKCLEDLRDVTGLTLVLVAGLLLSYFIILYSCDLLPDVSGTGDAMPITVDDITADDADYPHFAGRLHIPDVGIDVALYNSNSQATVDRHDSAAYFELRPWLGHMVIADHNNQSFRALHGVEVGMTCYIQTPDGATLYYECMRVFNGLNTGKYIAEENGRICMADADLLMYTCRVGWKYVRVCLWDKCEPPNDVQKGDDSLAR